MSGKKEKTSYFDFFCDITKSSSLSLVSAVADAISQQSTKLIVRLQPGGASLFPEPEEKSETGKKADDSKEAILCSNCINLEIWQSGPHNVKHEACSIKKLLVPKEKGCSHYKLIGTQGTRYLCRSCKYLDIWTSSSKDITAEVCSLRQIILPLKEICEHYKSIK